MFVALPGRVSGQAACIGSKRTVNPSAFGLAHDAVHGQLGIESGEVVPAEVGVVDVVGDVCQTAVRIECSMGHGNRWLVGALGIVAMAAARTKDITYLGGGLIERMLTRGAGPQLPLIPTPPAASRFVRAATDFSVRKPS